MVPQSGDSYVPPHCQPAIVLIKFYLFTDLIYLRPGFTLSEKEPIAQFDVPDIPEEYVVHSHKLIIKQISLGPEAKSGEFNVVQVRIAINYYQPCSNLGRFSFTCINAEKMVAP